MKRKFEPRKPKRTMPDVVPAVEVARSTEEGALYLAERARSEYNYPENTDILNSLDNIAETAKRQRVDSMGGWRGVLPQPNSFANVEESVVKDAKTVLDNLLKSQEDVAATQDILSDVNVKISVDEQSRLMRGYQQHDTKPVEPELQNVLDGVFSAWIINEHMSNQDGVLYEATEKGEIKHGPNGESVKVSPQHFKEEVENPTRGLEQYIHEKSGIDVTLEVQTPVEPTAEVTSEASASTGQRGG